LSNWEFVESIGQIIFLAGFTSHGVLNKVPTVWPDGARPLLISLIVR